MTDLKTLVPEKDLIEVILKHPVSGETLLNDNGTEMTVTVYAPHTKQYRKSNFDRANGFIKQRGKDSFDMTFEDMEEISVTLLVDITADWDITFDGKTPKFTKSKAKEVFSEIFWIKDQADKALSEAQVFTKA